MVEKIGVFCSSSNQMAPIYYQEAERLGHWIGETGKTLVYGGCKCGLMEAVAQGVRKAGNINVIGVVPNCSSRKRWSANVSAFVFRQRDYKTESLGSQKSVTS